MVSMCVENVLVGGRNFNKFKSVGVTDKCWSAVTVAVSQSHSTVQYRTEQNRTVQYSAVQYSTVQYSTVQYSTVTVQYSSVQ